MTWDLVSVWFRGKPLEFQTIHFTLTAENILISYGYPRYLSNTVLYKQTNKKEALLGVNSDKRHGLEPAT